jgi:hypothetical protein
VNGAGRTPAKGRWSRSRANWACCSISFGLPAPSTIRYSAVLKRSGQQRSSFRKFRIECFFVDSEMEREHRPSSGDCDFWLGLKCEGRWGVSSTSLKFRTPTCIEPNHGAQIRMRMEAGFQVPTFLIEIYKEHCRLRTHQREIPRHPAETARQTKDLLEWCSAARVRVCRAWGRALASSAPFQLIVPRDGRLRRDPSRKTM